MIVCVIINSEIKKSEYDDNVRIMIVKYEGNIYRIKRINGEDEEIQVIGYERYEK